MNITIKNILAVIAGLFIGSIVNMGIINISDYIIAVPVVDANDMESLKESMHMFEPKHFVMPFLAHALGTLVGAFVASLIAETHKLKFALAIAFFFLFGGIFMVFILPSPLWFNIVDLVFAYIPMAWLGFKISKQFQK